MGELSYGLNLGWGGPIGEYIRFWWGPIKGYTTYSVIEVMGLPQRFFFSAWYVNLLSQKGLQVGLRVDGVGGFGMSGVEGFGTRVRMEDGFLA